MRNWLESQSWSEVEIVESASKKAEVLQNMLVKSYHLCFTVQGDLPAKLYKEFAAIISEPLTSVYNASIHQGEYPSIYKYEISTPVPKKYPVETVSQMRKISGLLTADEVFEKLLSEIIIGDMKDKADCAQYGNEKQTFIQHYLIKMIHRIQEALDNNSRRQIFAAIANMIDCNYAFVRQCPKLGFKLLSEKLGETKVSPVSPVVTPMALVV